MGALIRVAAPTPAGVDAARTSYSVGRSLTAADFGRQDRYIDARLLGLAPATVGAITGLAVSPARFDSPNGTAGLTTLTIGAGSGICGDGHLVRLSTPISVSWKDLVDVVTGQGTLADGAYLVLLRTFVFDGLEGPPPDERAGSDPLLDIRQDSFAQVWLSTRIGALPASRSSAQLALALNTLVGGLTPTSLGAAIANGVPLALVLVLNSQPILLSQAAGRLPADPNGLSAMLLAQVREAFAMALAEPGADPTSANWQSGIRARFRFLPAAGELPAGLLLAPEAVSASCPFFPPGFIVYLLAIRASQAPHLLQQALGGPQLDLTSNTAQAVALALAIPDAAWTRDLLDIPRGDPVLAADVHLAYARARAAQVVVREAWIALYGGMNAVVAARAQAVGFLLASDAAAQDLSSLLNTPATTGGISATDLLGAADLATSPVDLLGWVAARITALTAPGARPPPVAVPTTDAATASKQLAELGYQMPDPEPAQADPAVAGHVPIDSDTVLAPLIPSLPQGSNLAGWTAAITAAQPDPLLMAPLIDAGIVDANSDAATRAVAIATLLALPATGDPLNDDTQPGALLRLALLQLFYAVFVPDRAIPRACTRCPSQADHAATAASRHHVHLGLGARRRRPVGWQRTDFHPPHSIRDADAATDADDAASGAHAHNVAERRQLDPYNAGERRAARADPNILADSADLDVRRHRVPAHSVDHRGRRIHVLANAKSTDRRERTDRKPDRDGAAG
jgi:hypothetical protein